FHVTGVQTCALPILVAITQLLEQVALQNGDLIAHTRAEQVQGFVAAIRLSNAPQRASEVLHFLDNAIAAAENIPDPTLRNAVLSELALEYAQANYAYVMASQDRTQKQDFARAIGQWTMQMQESRLVPTDTLARLRIMEANALLEAGLPDEALAVANAVVSEYA